MRQQIATRAANLLATDTEPKGASAETLAALLESHNPDAGYADWLRVGMVLHHETAGSGAGFKLWDEWSAKGQKYKGSQDLVNHWRSFQRCRVQALGRVEQHAADH
jgi:hypothetical protein